MHTAYDRPDNSEPASVTLISVSKFVFFDIEFIEIFPERKFQFSIFFLPEITGLFWLAMQEAVCIPGVYLTCPEDRLLITG